MRSAIFRRRPREIDYKGRDHVRANRHSVLRFLQILVLVMLAGWTIVGHTILINITGFSAWRLGGFGMYGEPGGRYLAVAVIRCSTKGDCDFASQSAGAIAPRATPGGTISIFDAYHEENTLRWGRDVVLSFGPTGLERRNQQAFETAIYFPTIGNATRLIRLLPREACPTHCIVAHYRQRVSLLARLLEVDSRVFFVPSTGNAK